MGGMQWVSAVDYIDDITVHSDSRADHCAYLRPARRQPSAAPSDVLFRRRSVRYLGHIVSWRGIRPGPSKVQPIRDRPPPANARAVQGPSVPKQCLLALTHTTSGPFPSTATARATASARILLKPYEEGERVIAYASCSLHDHEKKWTATQLEAAGDIWAVETFRHYLDTAEAGTDRKSSFHAPNSGGAALECTDGDAEAELYLEHTEDEALPQLATPRTPNTAQHFIHGGRNIRCCLRCTTRLEAAGVIWALEKPSDTTSTRPRLARTKKQLSVPPPCTLAAAAPGIQVQGAASLRRPAETRRLPLASTPSRLLRTNPRSFSTTCPLRPAAPFPAATVV
ncbi:hypothetical protein ACSSS7_001214 [Eimeria intestinalis]